MFQVIEAPGGFLASLPLLTLDMVLDGDGHVHIAFITQSGVYGDYSLKHAAWSGSQWQIIPIATLAEYTEPRPAIDVQDHLHLD